MIQMKRKMNMSQEYKIRLGSKRRVPKGMYVNRRERKKERNIVTSIGHKR